MPELFRAQLPRDESCEAAGRRLLEQHLSDDRFGARLVSNVKLVVSELISNAFLHGRGAIELVARVSDGRLRVDVVDEGEGKSPDVQIATTDHLHGGWGLEIVDGLALAWGAFEGSTHVWAEFGIDD
jgi:anti-sigma regulatory factor (Ser/Thr protein kinase)